MDRRTLIAHAAALSAMPAWPAAARPLPPLPLPALPGDRAWRIAFGSCMHQERPQPIWEAVLAFSPDLFLFTGDNVYGDVRGPEALELEEAYRLAGKVEGLGRLRRTVPHLATWDDHDYGGDDAGAGVAWQARAQDLFCAYWQVPPDDPRRQRTGVHHAAILGAPPLRIQVILLDTRSFRAAWRRSDAPGTPGKERYIPDPDPAKSLLGQAQWAWLAERLQEEADVRLIVSSIQVLSDAHGFERWGLLPHERARLLDLLAAPSAGQVLLLSGDRHFGALYRRGDLGPRTLTEATSSGINMVYAGVDAAREPDPHRLADPYAAENFGTIEIDPDGTGLRLAIRGLDGEPVQELWIGLGVTDRG